MPIDVVYRDREGGRFVFYTYSEGRRVRVSEKWVSRELARKTIRVVYVT